MTAKSVYPRALVAIVSLIVVVGARFGFDLNADALLPVASAVIVVGTAVLKSWTHSDKELADAVTAVVAPLVDLRTLADDLAERILEGYRLGGVVLLPEQAASLRELVLWSLERTELGRSDRSTKGGSSLEPDPVTSLFGPRSSTSVRNRDQRSR
jgi:hypothetical protein